MKTKYHLNQYHTQHDLTRGNLVGAFSPRTILKSNNLGVGTYTGGCGELVMVNHRMYQIFNNNEIKVVSPNNQNQIIPFSTACWFEPTTNFWNITQPLKLVEFDTLLLDKLPNSQLCYVAKVHAQFSSIQIRSFIGSTQANTSVKQLVQSAKINTIKDITGILVVIMPNSDCKPLISTVSHIHFISDDETWGGHVVDFVMEQGEVQLNSFTQVKLHF